MLDKSVFVGHKLKHNSEYGHLGQDFDSLFDPAAICCCDMPPAHWGQTNALEPQCTLVPKAWQRIKYSSKKYCPVVKASYWPMSADRETALDGYMKAMRDPAVS